jgi:DNA-binding beta-propeller fold protein YncE
MKRLHATFGVSLCLGLAALAANPHLTADAADDKTPKLKVLKTIPLGGEGKWDYLCVDAEGRRLYVPRTTTVQVVDLDKGVLVDTIVKASGTRVHGVALAPEQKLGFITAGNDNCVNAFDLKTLKLTTTIKTGANPDSIVYDPFSKHVFAINHSGSDITVIDPAALPKTATIPVPGKLETGVADGAGRVFVCVEDTNEVVQIDGKANKLLARWPLESGKGPTGMAIDTQRMRLFAGCTNGTMVILDAKSGKILGTTAIGKGVDGVAYDPALGFAVSANGKDGTLSVVKEIATGKFETIQTVKTFSGAKTITVDLKMHQFLLPCDVPNGKDGKTFGIVVVGAEAK